MPPRPEPPPNTQLQGARKEGVSYAQVSRPAPTNLGLESQGFTVWQSAHQPPLPAGTQPQLLHGSGSYGPGLASGGTNTSHQGAASASASSSARPQSARGNANPSQSGSQKRPMSAPDKWVTDGLAQIRSKTRLGPFDIILRILDESASAF
ncbi:hypothetical protein DFP72DRAFT_146767, partial [Ephemerocybe angulata]